MIEYSIEVYIEIKGNKGNSNDRKSIYLGHKREIDVREYLFTDEEIEEDWKGYQKIIDLKKVLRPNTIFGGNSDTDVHNGRKD